MAQMVKNLPAAQETQIQPLGWEDREWLPTPVFLPGRFHGQRSLEGLQSMGLQRAVDTTERLTISHLSLS